MKKIFKKSKKEENEDYVESKETIESNDVKSEDTDETTKSISIDISKEVLQELLKRHYAHFPDNYFLPTFLDNHDMDRFLFLCGDDKEKLKEGAQIQFSMNQPAIIYYGTEIGMTQTTSMWDISVHGDIQARQPMNWKIQDIELLEFYKKLIKQRKT